MTLSMNSQVGHAGTWVGHGFLSHLRKAGRLGHTAGFPPLGGTRHVPPAPGGLSRIVDLKRSSYGTSKTCAVPHDLKTCAVLHLLTGEGTSGRSVERGAQTAKLHPLQNFYNEGSNGIR